MKACESMVCWNDVGRGQGLPRVRVFRWPDVDDAGRAYENTAGACYAPGVVRDDFHATGERLLLSLLCLFRSLVVVEGLDAREVHGAFLEVDEYREAFGEGRGAFLDAEGGGDR